MNVTICGLMLEFWYLMPLMCADCFFVSFVVSQQSSHTFVARYEIRQFDAFMKCCCRWAQRKRSESPEKKNILPHVSLSFNFFCRSCHDIKTINKIIIYDLTLYERTGEMRCNRRREVTGKLQWRMRNDMVGISVTIDCVEFNLFRQCGPHTDFTVFLQFRFVLQWVVSNQMAFIMISTKNFLDLKFVGDSLCSLPTNDTRSVLNFG